MEILNPTPHAVQFANLFGASGPLETHVFICTREFLEDVSLEVGPEPGVAESQGPVVILTDGPTVSLTQHRAPGCQGNGMWWHGLGLRGPEPARLGEHVTAWTCLIPRVRAPLSSGHIFAGHPVC